MDAYSYTGSAGQMVSLAFYWSNGNYGIPGTVDVYSPSGQWVTNVTVSGNGAAANWTLPSSGTYTLLVHATSYNVTSGYALSIQTTTGGGCNSSAISCGQTVNTNTIHPSQMDAYGFGYGGGITIFTFSGYSGARFDLYDPSGNKMFTGTSGSAINTNLATAGTYTLVVHDASYAGTGNYGFTVTCFGGCNYVISPTSVSVGASATTGSITVLPGLAVHGRQARM